MMNAQRIAVLVDVQNLFYATKNYHNNMIAYGDFLKWIANGRSVVRAIAYTVEKVDANQEKFKKLLEKYGYDLRTKRLIERSDGSSKGNWDIAIAVDALQIAPRVDTIVLGTGDGDFTYLVEALKYIGLRTEVVSVARCTAMSLIEAADEYRELDRSIMMSKRRPRPKINKK